MQICTASFPSMTRALGAQRALSRAAIPSRIVRLTADRTTRGCAYGLSFSCAQLQNVMTILAQAGNPASRYFGGDSP